MSTQNSEPAGDARWKADVPPHQLGERFVMTSPMPVPSIGPVSWPARWNGWKILSCLSRRDADARVDDGDPHGGRSG